MKHRTTSYLLPFDPHDTGEPFGLLRANISGRAQWWLVQVWADDDADESIMVRFLDLDGPNGDFLDAAENYRGLPWFAISWISDDIPRRSCPVIRVQLDFPQGVRVSHEWQDVGLVHVDPAAILKTLDLAFRSSISA